MALTQDRQGYLGKLENKTLPELKELLERQEKILSDKYVEHTGGKKKKLKFTSMRYS